MENDCNSLLNGMSRSRVRHKFQDPYVFLLFRSGDKSPSSDRYVSGEMTECPVAVVHASLDFRYVQVPSDFLNVFVKALVSLVGEAEGKLST